MEQFLLQTVWFVPFYGVVGAVLTLPWSAGVIRETGPRPAAYLNLLMTVVAFIHGSVAFAQILQQETQQLVFHWFQAADLDLSLVVEISPVSLGAMGVVTGVSLLAQIYALGYLEKDWSIARFYGLMGFFEAAMAGIAISDSLFLSYALLEMLTLSTYLLVGFWYAQPLVVTAARDAFLTKRVGDIILLMGIVALSSYGAGLKFSDLAVWVDHFSLPPLISTLIGLSLIAGPTGKCAQFPLNLWLDEAMEGPNPAGILRNSVVVSSGAYVLIKLQPVFTLSPIASSVLIAIGTVTAIGASLMAIAQIDIKRTLSHSTSAYLGLVFVAVGLGHVDIAFMLLLVHAIGKALLFMSIGAIILTTHNQNVTEMGGLWSKMPATTLSFAVGSLTLVVALPMGFFWTMQQWMSGLWNVPAWLLVILIVVNGLSALNLTRVFRLAFLGEAKGKTRRAPEVAWHMAFPMVALTIVNFVVFLVPQQWPLWLSSTAPLMDGGGLIQQIAMPALVLSGLVGGLIGGTMELRRSWARPVQASLRFWQDFLAYDFYIQRLYELTVIAPISALSKISDWFDRYIVDGMVNLVGLVTILSGQSLRYNASGQFQFYILTILVAVGLLLVVLVNLPI